MSTGWRIPDQGARRARNRAAKKVVNAREAAAILGVGRRTVQLWRALGQMPKPDAKFTTRKSVVWNESVIRDMAANRALHTSAPIDAKVQPSVEQVAS